VAAGNILAFINTEDWLLGNADFNPWDYKLWAVLEDMACQKHHNKLDSLKRSLVKAVEEIPSGDGVCHNNRVAGASQGLRRGRGRPF
jgi:hypothetical protein